MAKALRADSTGLFHRAWPVGGVEGAGDQVEAL